MRDNGQGRCRGNKEDSADVLMNWHMVGSGNLVWRYVSKSFRKNIQTGFGHNAVGHGKINFAIRPAQTIVMIKKKGDYQ